MNCLSKKTNQISYVRSRLRLLRFFFLKRIVFAALVYEYIRSCAKEKGKSPVVRNLRDVGHAQSFYAHTPSVPSDAAKAAGLVGKCEKITNHMPILQEVVRARGKLFALARVSSLCYTNLLYNRWPLPDRNRAPERSHPLEDVP